MQGKHTSSTTILFLGLVLFVMLQFLAAQAAGDVLTVKQEIESLIEAGQLTEAQIQIDKLKADYSQDSQLPLALYWIAEKYRWSGQYEQTKAIHQHIIQNYSGDLYADKAQLAYSRTEVLSLIASQNYNGAQAAVNQLITEFSGNPDLPGTLYWVGRGFGWSNRYKEEKSIYQQIAQSYPKSQYANKALLGFSRANIQSLIMSGEHDQAQTALGKLSVDFSGHADLPYTLYSIAVRWMWSGNYSAADDLYEQITQQYPGNQFAEKAQADLQLTQRALNIFTAIESGQEQAAQSAINQLVTDFNGHELLPHTVFMCGEQYHKRAFEKRNEGLENEAAEDFARAIDTWKMITEELPACNTTPEGYYHLALAYRQLGEYGLAIENYTRVVEDYPDYQFAWDAQFMIGHCYEKLLKAGLLPESAAKPLIASAYKAVLEKYPDCEAAKAAQHRLAASAGYTTGLGTWAVDSNEVD